MSTIRIALETSITRFVGTGLGVYATNLASALGTHRDQVTIIPCAVPSAMARAPHPLVQKLYAAYWQIVHAQMIVPFVARRQRCDLVHYTMTMPIPQRMPCPTIATVHDLIPLIHPEWVPAVRGRRMRHGLQLTMARATHVLTNSEVTRRDVLAHSGRAADQVIAVWLGADTQLPDIHTQDALTIVQQHLKLQPGYILCVGSIEPRKNLDQVLRAYQHMLQRPSRPPRLVIAGGNVWKHDQFQRQIDQYGLRDHIVCTGHVAAQQLAALFRCAGVFVYPSLYEGFGFPPLEAMRARCPVITSNVSSLPEVVGDAALLVDPYDVGELATAIERVLTDQMLATQLRSRGSAHAQQFTWQRCAQETIEVYRKVLGQ